MQALRVVVFPAPLGPMRPGLLHRDQPAEGDAEVSDLEITRTRPVRGLGCAGAALRVPEVVGRPGQSRMARRIRSRVCRRACELVEEPV